MDVSEKDIALSIESLDKIVFRQGDLIILFIHEFSPFIFPGHSGQGQALGF
jgi:hypothetical protein